MSARSAQKWSKLLEESDQRWLNETLECSFHPELVSKRSLSSGRRSFKKFQSDQRQHINRVARKVQSIALEQDRQLKENIESESQERKKRQNYYHHIKGQASQPSFTPLLESHRIPMRERSTSQQKRSSSTKASKVYQKNKFIRELDSTLDSLSLADCKTLRKEDFFEVMIRLGYLKQIENIQSYYVAQ